MKRLENKVAIITGGAAGIGLATTKRFILEGAKVVFTDVNDTEGTKVQKELGNKAVFIKQNVASENDWIKVVQNTLDKFGKIDILFNNAGIYRIKPIIDISLDEWKQLLDININGVFLGMKHVLPKMASNNSGSVINASSIAGLIGSAGHVLYGASKGAVRIMSKDEAAEYATHNIRVNSIHPGYITTAMSDYASESLKLSKEELNKTYPLGRMGKPEEVANLVLFLASDEAAFITGTEIPIDGGFTSK
ncbi:MAG: glucose 1-dehydrogenase [Lactobacillus sp.]|uniref:Short-chain dehydrogenase n=1 Tax=Bombilactobacillus bombi TaxID=1303590 RepID=A0A347ST83_9LACO|nr:glucose 1-dehydrogenase [Bombilactobacillus bombi]AXX65242.1 SDR family oxidoreductase [Bombilactobacillus bombi]MCO6542080.1 glucose 1-dehydrogenase [Lactobacillus sp.]MCO6543758.1 glucose 1-dehydrogenase [Lactobacillus sp.]RHW52356.1 short-chain dehydrogenase [Bombilactobacillus bombi]